MALLEVKNLTVRFDGRNGEVRAVNDLSYVLEKGETLGIVGESGCGKSVSCYALMGLLPSPPARISGDAFFDGLDLTRLDEKARRAVRGDRISMIFQDPMTSLNPYHRIGAQLMEPLFLHREITKEAARDKALQALREVGVNEPERRLRQYPHEFSGGMRQRVMIAMALIADPEILIADEPTTALDVTVQARVLELLETVARHRHMATVLITHDLGVVARACDRALVMYAGSAMEIGPVDAIFHESRHPYAIALRKSAPSLLERRDTLYSVPGAPPDLSRPLKGCPFAPRCDRARPSCSDLTLRLIPVGADHFTACPVMAE